MLFLLSLSLMRTAGAPAHTSNLYVSKAADSYSFNEENRSDNNFTTKHHAGLCKTYIDDLITEKGRENISYSNSEIIKNRKTKENKSMATLTIIISLIILAIYIFLLVAKSKNKSNPKTNGMLMVVQGALWTMIAVSNWAENTVVNRGVYIILIVLSFIYGIRELIKQH